MSALLVCSSCGKPLASAGERCCPEAPETRESGIHAEGDPPRGSLLELEIESSGNGEWQVA